MSSILGHVHNGVVVFDGGASMPEGATVRVELLEASDQSGHLKEQLLQWAGKGVELPHDLARRHDHYLHRRED